MPVLDDTLQLSLNSCRQNSSIALSRPPPTYRELRSLVIRRALRSPKTKSIYSNTFITRVVTFVFPMDYFQPPRILPTDNVNRDTTVNISRAITLQTSEVRSLGQPQAFENICNSRNGEMASSHIVHNQYVSLSTTCSLSHAD